MKKISIVIPTRSRAHLLRFALKSAVRQTYKNKEIVVCDNQSIDNTKEIAHSFPNNQIVYMKSRKHLSMPDNWELALSKATGEYITYLTDDSYLLPFALERTVGELEKFNARVAVWKYGTYFTSDWGESWRKNTLYIPKVSSTSCLLASKKSLQRLYGMDENVSPLIPRSLNSLCHRSVIDKIMAIQGRFFLPPCPDYTSAASILLNIPEYLLIDQPLSIDGVTPLSIGATNSFNLGDGVQTFIKEFDKGLDDIFFLRVPTATAGIAKGLETVKKFYKNVCPEIDEKKLLCTMIDRLRKLESNGVNITMYQRILYEYIKKQPMNIRLAALRQKFFSTIKRKAIARIRSSSWSRQLEKLRSGHTLDGRDWKFNNIEEAANLLTKRINGNSLPNGIKRIYKK